MLSVGINNETNPTHGGGSNNGEPVNSSQPTILDESIQISETAISDAGADQGGGVISNSTSDMGSPMSNNSTVDHVTGTPSNFTESAVQNQYASKTVNVTDIGEPLHLSSSVASEEISTMPALSIHKLLL